MEQILDLNLFEVDKFDEVVATALNPSSPDKSKAESILLQFKELSSSWTKIDIILKNSKSKNSQFIALQILEETVRSKWVLFDEEMKKAMRQYVFSFIIDFSNNVSKPDANIILSKFNAVLIEIIKKDWPNKWPTFITDLVSLSQSTSMKVSNNTLIILTNINEQIFIVEEGITTLRKRKLRQALKQEYFVIFQFISVILEYSVLQDVDDSLLESCLNCFKSFCNSMSSEFIFSTKIIDHIIKHLNSPHSVAAIECLNGIVELKNINVGPSEILKIVQIHTELISFFSLYLSKFPSTEKLSNDYKRMDESEKLFLKKVAKIYSSIYSNYLFSLENFEAVKQGMAQFVELSKIEDPELFKYIFPAWAKIIHSFYSEYPLRIPTSKPLTRNMYSHILKAMLPVFVNNMPRPEEVFITINEFGEVVKNRNIETFEIEFYKNMRQNLFYLSYCIEDYVVNYFIKKSEKFISGEESFSSKKAGFDPVQFNKVCWAIGSFANALEEVAERDFFVSVLKNLLIICEIRTERDEKAIVASNIMFIVGQYHRFLKYHTEFLSVVISKLFEFMEETHSGIKEMACDNFYKICERCPGHFFIKVNKNNTFEIVLNKMSSITSNLDYYLIRIVIEGLLLVLKNSQRKEPRYIELIYSALTDPSVLNEQNIGLVLSYNTNQLKMVLHLIESYTIGFKIQPEIFLNLNVVSQFLLFYKNLSNLPGSANSRNVSLIKSSLCALNEAIVEAKYTDDGYLDNLCANILLDFKTSFDPCILSLAKVVFTNNNIQNDISSIQRLQFFVNNLIIPSITFVMKSDEYPDLTLKYLELLYALAKENFSLIFNIIQDHQSYELIINSVLFSLTGMQEISELALNTLILFFRESRRFSYFTFFNRFYFITLENVLGIIFDKDLKHSFDLQVELLLDMLSSLSSITIISNQTATSNKVLVRDFVADLFSKNFKNLTENSVKVFIEGILEIRNLEAFKEHINDFSIKIYEYNDDEDIQDEYNLLNERIKV